MKGNCDTFFYELIKHEGGSTQAKGSKIFGIKRQIDTQKYGVTLSKKVLGVTVVLGVERSQKQSVIQGFGGDVTKFNFQLSF